MKVEKSFVIEREDMQKLQAILSSHYRDKMLISNNDDRYDLNISFAEEKAFINVLENNHWETDFPEKFITEITGLFSCPVYLFLDSNNIKLSEDFFSFISDIRKVLFDEMTNSN